MSDALQDAEALYELLGKSENYVTVKDVLKGAIEEIKRLREQISRLGRLAFFAKDEPVEKIIDHFVQWGDSTFKYLQELKGQLAKWQQIAIEERADHIAAMHVLTGMVPIRSIPATVATVEDHVAGFRERAAKELGLQIEQEASYVKRLEEKISDFYECDATRRGCCRQVAQDQARAALVKIREGK